VSRQLTDAEWDAEAERQLDHQVRLGATRPTPYTAEQAIKEALVRAVSNHRDIIDPWESVNHRLYIEGLRLALRDARGLKRAVESGRIVIIRREDLDAE
jgi:hypothetical protein